jgi:hypothetical protein
MMKAYLRKVTIAKVEFSRARALAFQKIILRNCKRITDMGYAIIIRIAFIGTRIKALLT